MTKTAAPKGAKISFRPPALGGVSLLVIFAVLCLTVFALLSLSTVQADIRLADASAQAVTDYYAADTAAEEILARLRAGELPEGVAVEESNIYFLPMLGAEETTAGIYSYSLAINDSQKLEVTVQIIDANNWQIIRWQAVPETGWVYDDNLEVWDGSSF